MSNRPLRDDALRIWNAGLAAVRSERLVQQAFRVEDDTLVVRDVFGAKQTLSLAAVRRIVVVGAGKAGAGMAEGVEQSLGERLMAEKRLTGWVNVPADCVRPLVHIHLHPARPAGVNEPCEEGVAGTCEIMRLVASLGPDDLCLCLISGGGSALLPAPVEGITLTDKLAVTRHLSAAGANIEQLNTVRKQLSRIKGGGLLHACRAGRLIALVISDVLGDPLDTIASGPTVSDSSTPAEALAVLDRFGARQADVSPRVFEFLENAAKQPMRQADHQTTSFATNCIIANNATAVAAARDEAERLGYAVLAESASCSEGPAEEVGRQLLKRTLALRPTDRPCCLISGGEPVVELVESSRRGLGGRNQQLVLAALASVQEKDAAKIVMLSGGTDGEDGPTNAAGAMFDSRILHAAREKKLDPADYLARNDAYHFFDPLDALIRTGPTHTNVCDLRVVIKRSLPD